MANQKIPISSLSLGFLFFFLAFTNLSVAQCAGSDNTVTVCTKDQDVGNRTFDLFANLGGTPTTGGVWSTTNPANFIALDAPSGIVDLWRINNFGVHEFVYTNDCGGASPETATVTINLGGYPGEDNTDGSANTCGDSPFVNLHSFLGSEIEGKVQDFNGLWEEVPAGATGLLTNNVFNAQVAGPGVYTFTYTVSAVDACPSRQSTVILEAHAAANPGIASNLVVCTNEDLSAYTNYNLNARLFGEDPNGTWSESSTNQISDLTDNIIDVQAINANFGYGTYIFRYLVFPTHPVCTQQFSEVNVIILPALEGSLTAPNFCQGMPYEIQLDYDNTILPNGTYEIDYRISDSAGIKTEMAETVLNNGQGTFEVLPSLVSLNEFVDISIIGIEGISPMRDVCPTIDVPPASFLVSNPVASAQDICPETVETITLSNILDVSGNLSNGTHDVVYTLTDPNSSSSTFTAQNIGFINGAGSFDIPFTNLPEAGGYTVSIDIPDAFAIDCMIDTTFTITPYPEDITLDLLVDNTCDATQIDVIVDAPVLADGGYLVTYEVTERESTTVLVSNTISFNGGTADYLIDIATLPMGNYTVLLKSTQNDTTPCRLIFDFELEENFAIGGIPEPPQATANQTFCTTAYEPDGPTLADIEVTASGDIMFYENETDITELSPLTLLLDGEDYFISNIDPINSCESSERIRAVVTLATPQTVTSTNTTPLFCSSENPTIASLNVTAPSGTLVWYDAAIGGTILNTTENLINGRSYFAVETINGECEGAIRLEVIPTVIRPELPSLQDENLSICGLEGPTVENLQELVNTSDWSIRWFDSVSGGQPLFLSDSLQDRSTYYAESYDATTGCTNPERIPVSVDLSNCSPEDYNFFIPDGFSPNGDGRNDTFFIPNIEVIFPDFTLEIYNRYGSSLFKGNKDNPSWDGSNGNGMAPNGVYFYVIDYNKEGFKPIQGRFYLNR